MILDTLVIGGGPAGLLAGMYLARFRRSVVVVDAGTSRAHRIPRSHNYPGMVSGVSGAELITSLRGQLAFYQVATVAAEIVSLRHESGHFIAEGSHDVFESRTVLLATGVQDIEPEIPHLAEALRDGAVRYCPVCDAFEVIDRRIAVLVSGAPGAAEAICLRRYSDRVTVIPVDERAAAGLTGDDRARLERAGLTVGLPFKSFRMWNGTVTVEHVGSTDDHIEPSEFDTVYCALGMSVRSSLALTLKAEADESGYLLVDRHQQTTIPGLYAAGDVASGLNQISVAYGTAAIAAAAINVNLSTTIQALSS